MMEEEVIRLKTARSRAVEHIDHDMEEYSNEILDLIINRIQRRAGTQYISIRELEWALAEAFGVDIRAVRILPDQRYE